MIPVMQPNLNDLTAQTVSTADGRRVLRVTLSDGRSLDISADRLRTRCRCAICSRARIDGTFVTVEGIRIEQVTPIGQYGVNLAFSDGHVRGIFPFAYLAELAAFEAVPDEASTDDAGRSDQVIAI